MTTTDWYERGRCKGSDPSLFHPEDEDDPADGAKAVCALCRVRDSCFEHAIVKREPVGVWGGHTAKERRRVIRQRRKAG